MAKRDVAKKFVLNYLVMGGTGLPNLAITGTSLTLLTVYFHVFPFLAYLAGLFLSMTYSNVFSMVTKSNFEIFGRKYSFSHRKEDSKP